MARSQSATLRFRPPYFNKVEHLERAKRVERTTNMPYFVYILRTSLNTLYIGQTNNLEKRLKEHKSKSIKSAKYVRYFDSVSLVYSEKYATRKEAIQRETQLKKWSKAKKETIIRISEAQEHDRSGKRARREL